jgi:hypothetical protein
MLKDEIEKKFNYKKGLKKSKSIRLTNKIRDSGH